MKTEDLVRASAAILLDMLLVLALMSLFFLDGVVNGLLYDYGLVFSVGWAESYWLFMRVSMALIGIAIAIISIVWLLYPLLRKFRNVRKG